MNIVVGNPIGFEDITEVLFDSEPFLIIEADTVEALMWGLQVFKSKGESRRNGFSGEIPFGLNKIGPKRSDIWVWRIPPQLQAN